MCPRSVASYSVKTSKCYRNRELFPFSQNFQSNRLKCKWNAWIKQTSFGGSPHSPFQLNGTEIAFYLYKNSISTVRESARAYTSFLHQHDLPMKSQVFAKFREFQTENFTYHKFSLISFSRNMFFYSMRRFKVERDPVTRDLWFDRLF